MIKSFFDLYILKKSLITERKNNRSFQPKIIKFKYNFTKNIENLNIPISIKSIGIIIYSILDKNKYSSFNVGIITGIDSNDSNRNQNSLIVINLKFMENLIDFLNIFYIKIKYYSYNINGIYFASTFKTFNKLNIIKNTINKKIDLQISILPITKSYVNFLNYDCDITVYNPYHISSLYSQSYLKEGTIHGYLSMKLDDYEYKYLKKNIEKNKLLQIQ